MTTALPISATTMHRQRGSLLKRCFRDKVHFIIEKDEVPLAVLIPIDHYVTATQPTPPEPPRA
jgi:hypothetical protein